jgi:hypothetical protein
VCALTDLGPEGVDVGVDARGRDEPTAGCATTPAIHFKTLISFDFIRIRYPITRPNQCVPRVAKGRKGIRNSLSEFALRTLVRFAEGAAALLASLKSFQQPRQGGSGEKGDPFCGPYLTLGTLAAPIYLATPAGPRARTGQRAMVNHVFVTDHPTAK